MERRAGAEELPTPQIRNSQITPNAQLLKGNSSNSKLLEVLKIGNWGRTPNAQLRKFNSSILNFWKSWKLGIGSYLGVAELRSCEVAELIRLAPCYRSRFWNCQ